jgi:hypothetical protein
LEPPAKALMAVLLQRGRFRGQVGLDSRMQMRNKNSKALVKPFTAVSLQRGRIAAFPLFIKPGKYIDSLFYVWFYIM